MNVPMFAATSMEITHATNITKAIHMEIGSGSNNERSSNYTSTTKSLIITNT